MKKTAQKKTRSKAPSRESQRTLRLAAAMRRTLFAFVIQEGMRAFDQMLEEALCVVRTTVVLAHADLPSLLSDEQRIYLAILAESVDSWRDTAREFGVTFPTDCAAQVRDA